MGPKNPVGEGGGEVEAQHEPVGRKGGVWPERLEGAGRDVFFHTHARRKTREDAVLIVDDQVVRSVGERKIRIWMYTKNKIDQVVVFGLLLLLRGVCFAVAVSGAFETNSSCLLNKFPRIPARLGRLKMMTGFCTLF